ncbi:MAG: 3-dehydroquinate synthase, partial [Lentimonas sp.]
VLCDLDFLETLSDRHFTSGYAEVVKYGFINDKKFFEFLDKNLSAIKNRDKDILQQIIVKSCQIKAKIVELDEKENGLRATLNFGHTFGHVFEKQTGYCDVLFHGEAIAIGMVMAAKMSVNLGFLDQDLAFLISDHLRKIGLPTSIKNIKNNSWRMADLVSHLYKDKKVDGQNLTFILLENIGKCSIKKNIDEKEFIKVVGVEL